MQGTQDYIIYVVELSNECWPSLAAVDSSIKLGRRLCELSPRQHIHITIRKDSRLLTTWPINSSECPSWLDSWWIDPIVLLGGVHSCFTLPMMLLLKKKIDPMLYYKDIHEATKEQYVNMIRITDHLPVPTSALSL
jgi:hypothetical protein